MSMRMPISSTSCLRVDKGCVAVLFLSEIDHHLSGLLHIQKQMIPFRPLQKIVHNALPETNDSISVCGMTQSCIESLRLYKVTRNGDTTAPQHQTDHFPVSCTTASLSGSHEMVDVFTEISSSIFFFSNNSWIVLNVPKKSKQVILTGELLVSGS